MSSSISYFSNARKKLKMLLFWSRSRIEVEVEKYFFKIEYSYPKSLITIITSCLFIYPFKYISFLVILLLKILPLRNWPNTNSFLGTYKSNYQMFWSNKNLVKLFLLSNSLFFPLLFLYISSLSYSFFFLLCCFL